MHWASGYAELTHIGQMAGWGGDMESQAIIAEGPIVPCLCISFGHDALNPQGFETRSEGNGTISIEWPVKNKLYQASQILRVSTPDDKDINFKLLDSTDFSSGGKE